MTEHCVIELQVWILKHRQLAMVKLDKFKSDFNIKMAIIKKYYQPKRSVRAQVRIHDLKKELFF